jgi:hypothetical protein
MLLAALIAMAIASPSDEGGLGPSTPGLGPIAPEAAAPLAPGPLDATQLLPPGTLEAFKALCVANNAQSAGAIQTAEKLNWYAVPQELLPVLAPDIALMKEAQTRMLSAPGGVYILLAGKSSGMSGPAGRPIPTAVCMVIGANVDPSDAALQADVTKWIGGEPADTSPDTAIYTYYTAANGVRAVLQRGQEKEARKVLDDGKANIIMLRFNNRTRMLIQIVPIQAN